MENESLKGDSKKPKRLGGFEYFEGNKWRSSIHSKKTLEPVIEEKSELV